MHLLKYLLVHTVRVLKVLLPCHPEMLKCVQLGHNLCTHPATVQPLWWQMQLDGEIGCLVHTLYPWSLPNGCSQGTASDMAMVSLLHVVQQSIT